MNDTKERLVAGKAVLLERGFTKYEFVNESGVCIRGALGERQCNNGPHVVPDAVYVKINKALRDLGYNVRDFGPIRYRVADWNNARDTNVDDVLKVFDRAIELA